MADDNRHPVSHLRPVRTSASTGRSLWGSFSKTAQGFILVATFTGGVGAAYYLLSSVVTADELTPISDEVERLDGEVEQQFRLHGILEQKVTNLEQRAEWSNTVLWRMAQDQGLDRGRDKLNPPPASPAEHPTPVQTSARPTPTETP